MKKILVACFMVLGLLVAGNAMADITFTLGNNPQPDEQNILLNSGATGNTVFGETNQTHTSVTFTSAQDLIEPPNGQARIEANTTADNTLTDLHIFLTNGGTFQDFILNPLCASGGGDCGTATITVIDNNNAAFTYNLTNGQNFLTIFATNGQSIESINIAATGFDSLDQPRISGVGGLAVPEPSILLLLGAGLVGMGVVARKRVKQ